MPRPVAAGQMVGPWGKLQGFLAVEELHGMLPLHEAVPLAPERLAPGRFRPVEARPHPRTGRGCTRELHLRRVFHKDLYFCHFYIPESYTRNPPSDWTKRVVMIDLHRLARHRFMASWWQVKDLAQLLYSSASKASRRGIACASGSFIAHTGRAANRANGSCPSCAGNGGSMNGTPVGRRLSHWHRGDANGHRTLL